MNNLKVARKAYPSLILIAFLLGGIYVLFSYYQTLRNTKSQNQTLLLHKQKEVTEAFHLFQQFLNLTEARLLYSLNKPEAISSILSGHVGHLMGKTLPEVLSMAFIPASDPHTRYTRFGKNLIPIEEKLDFQKSDIKHLENGTFKVSKVLYDDAKKAFGILQSTFSIASLLYQNFSQDEMKIVQNERNTLSEGQFFFKIPYLHETSIAMVCQHHLI